MHMAPLDLAGMYNMKHVVAKTYVPSSQYPKFAIWILSTKDGTESTTAFASVALKFSGWCRRGVDGRTV